MTDRTCPVCQTVYDANEARLRHGRQTTCSRRCSYELRASKLTDCRQMICSSCETQFYRSPSKIKSKHRGVYCSRDCAYAGRRSGMTGRIVTKKYRMMTLVDRQEAAKKAWASRRRNGTDRHSDATREKLRQATIGQLSCRKGWQVSKLEDEVAEVLSQRGFEFSRQIPIRDPDTGRIVALPDFLFLDGSVLEVNGTFWHSDPRFFPDGPVSAAQKRTAERYARKAAAYKRLGIKLMELWEADFRELGIEAVLAALSR